MSKDYREQLPTTSKLKLQKAASEVKKNDATIRAPQLSDDVLQKSLYNLGTTDSIEERLAPALENQDQVRLNGEEDGWSFFSNCVIL